MDLLHDQLSDGRRFRILAIVDDFACECLALVADTSVSGMRLLLNAVSPPPASPTTAPS
jgi:putative transposase